MYTRVQSHTNVIIPVPCQLEFLHVFGCAVATGTISIALGLSSTTAVATGTESNRAIFPL